MSVNSQSSKVLSDADKILEKARNLMQISDKDSSVRFEPLNPKKISELTRKLHQQKKTVPKMALASGQIREDEGEHETGGLLPGQGLTPKGGGRQTADFKSAQRGKEGDPMALANINFLDKGATGGEDDERRSQYSENVYDRIGFKGNKAQSLVGGSILPDIDPGTNIFITYCLHALEIERLIYMNKEQIEEANEMEKEIDELEEQNIKFETENGQLKQERDLLKTESESLRELVTQKDDEIVENKRSYDSKIRILNQKLEQYKEHVKIMLEEREEAEERIAQQMINLEREQEIRLQEIEDKKKEVELQYEVAKMQNIEFQQQQSVANERGYEQEVNHGQGQSGEEEFETLEVEFRDNEDDRQDTYASQQSVEDSSRRDGTQEALLDLQTTESIQIGSNNLNQEAEKARLQFLEEQQEMLEAQKLELLKIQIEQQEKEYIIQQKRDDQAQEQENIRKIQEQILQKQKELEQKEIEDEQLRQQQKNKEQVISRLLQEQEQKYELQKQELQSQLKKQFEEELAQKLEQEKKKFENFEGVLQQNKIQEQVQAQARLQARPLQFSPQQPQNQVLVADIEEEQPARLSRNEERAQKLSSLNNARYAPMTRSRKTRKRQQSVKKKGDSSMSTSQNINDEVSDSLRKKQIIARASVGKSIPKQFSSTQPLPSQIQQQYTSQGGRLSSNPPYFQEVRHAQPINNISDLQRIQGQASNVNKPFVMNSTTKSIYSDGGSYQPISNQYSSNQNRGGLPSGNKTSWYQYKNVITGPNILQNKYDKNSTPSQSTSGNQANMPINPLRGRVSYGSQQRSQPGYTSKYSRGSSKPRDSNYISSQIINNNDFYRKTLESKQLISKPRPNTNHQGHMYADNQLQYSSLNTGSSSRTPQNVNRPKLKTKPYYPRNVTDSGASRNLGLQRTNQSPAVYGDAKLSHGRSQFYSRNKVLIGWRNSSNQQKLEDPMTT